MKRFLCAAILSLLLTHPEAVAQRPPGARSLAPLCDTLSARLLERTGVDSKLEVYRVSKRGKSTLDLTFTRTLSDYPWHPEEQAWFKKVLKDEWKKMVGGYFTPGRIRSKTQSFEELSTPRYNCDGTPVKYIHSVSDPGNNSIPLVSRCSGKVFQLGLSGRHIALWQSHGRYFNDRDSIWRWQRAPLHRTVEDIFTQSYVLDFLIPMLENSGAYIMTPRERDTQRDEYIIDNDPSFPGLREGGIRRSGQHFEKGRWQTVSEGFADFSPVYTFRDNPFRHGSARMAWCTSGKESAFTSWTPYIEKRGMYAVYVSYKTLENSSPKAHYTVCHMGGNTEFTVNQRMGGGTWIYLGTFEFDKGTSGCVILDNRGRKGEAVCADAVKIGGGMGKLERGGRTSGLPSYLEGASYWMQWAGVDTTITRGWPTDYVCDYSCRGAWTDMMKKDKGIPIDLALGFHTDAGLTPNDSIVGTLAIYTNLNEGKKTFDDGRSRMISRLYADFVQDQTVSDIRTYFEPEWARREIWDRGYNETRTPGVPAMILELLSHQNFADMKYGLDPSFKFVVCRSVYKGILKTLSTIYNVPYAVQPLPVRNMSLRFTDDGNARLDWNSTPDSLETTARAESYIVYTRVDGGAFDSGISVMDSSATLRIEPGHIYSYKVVAVGKGGMSFPSEILSIGRPASESHPRVVIVNNFYRICAPAWVDSPGYAGFEKRLDTGVPYIRDISYGGENYEFRRSCLYESDENPGFGATIIDHATMIVAGNTFDYPYVHGKSLMKLGYGFCSMSRGAFCNSGASEYRIMDIICGKQKTTRIGRGAVPNRYRVFPSEFKQALENYTRGGGNVIISGANIASDEMGSDFTSGIFGYCHASSIGTNSGKMEDWEFHHEPNPDCYCVECPDGLRTGAFGAKVLFKYPFTGMGAAVRYRAKGYRSVSIGVPIEAFKEEKDREEILRLSLQALRTR